MADFDVCGEDSGESRSRLVLLMRQTKQNCVRAVGRSEREWTGDWIWKGASCTAVKRALGLRRLAGSRRPLSSLAEMTGIRTRKAGLDLELSSTLPHH